MQKENVKKMDIGEGLPGSGGVFALGIVALFTAFVLGVPGMICGLLALSKAKDCKQLYRDYPGHYWPETYDKVRYGLVMAWIGLIIGTGYVVLIFLAIAQQ